MTGIKADNKFKNDTQETAVGVLRSLVDLDFMFELNFNQRYYRAMACCNSKLQPKGLSETAVLAAFEDCVKDLENLSDALDDIEVIVKKQVLELKEIIDCTWMRTRQRARTGNLENHSVNMFGYETTIDDTIKRLKECIEAEKASCHDALLLSSMHVDTFNLYLAAKQVPQKNGNPFLFLSLIGSALPGVLASLDTTTIAKAFFSVRIIFLQLYE